MTNPNQSTQPTQPAIPNNRPSPKKGILHTSSFILHPSSPLLFLALALRLYYALQLPFPPLDDPAYYVQGARSLRTAHPLELSITWNYHPLFDTLPHPGFDFWMPMTSFLIAACFAVMGDTPLAAQLPSVIGGSLLAVFTFYLTRRTLTTAGLKPSAISLLSVLAGLYIALNPLLAYQSAVPDSEMIYAPLITAALLVWLGGQSNRRAFGFGLLLGLAYVTRSHAAFLGLAWLIVTIWQLRREPRKDLLRAAFTLLGLALTAGPWMVRTWLTFGFLNSPAGLQSGLIDDYATLFNYETPINFNTFLGLGWGRILEIRLIALRNAWFEVLGVMFFPTVLLPVVGLFLLWRRNRALGPALLYGLLLGFGLPLVFVAASSTGSFYHSAGSLAPLGALGYIYLLWLVSDWYKRRRPRSLSVLPVLVGVVVLLELFQLSVTISTTTEEHRRNEAVYARLGEWLATNASGQTVIADEPSSLNYATGLPALRLPADEPLEVLDRLARRYKARYIVVTGNFGRYPALLQAPSNTLFPRLYRDPQGQFEVYKVMSRS